MSTQAPDLGTRPADVRASSAERRPVRSAAGVVLRRAPGLTRRAEKLLWRALYEVGTSGRRRRATTTMNYGYAPIDEPAPPDGEPEDGFGLALLPKPLRRHALAFAAIEGSAMYDAYVDGRWTYLRLAVQRP